VDVVIAVETKSFRILGPSYDNPLSPDIFLGANLTFPFFPEGNIVPFVLFGLLTNLSWFVNNMWLI
jgi:hypothetical protein